MAYKVGMIGCGRRGIWHGIGYQASDQVEIVACADPFPAAREGFAARFDVPKAYDDYRKMLDKEDLDIVSVCTWTGMHKEQILAAVEAGVRAIHSEKPMATTWGDAKAIIEACDANDVMITFCHQRRFEDRFMVAKALLDAGEIGTLVRVEGACDNLFDWGTHWFDMFNYYNGDVPARWVLGQVDANPVKVLFDVPMETSGISWIRYQNGVEGLLTTGKAELSGPRNRLLGSEGVIEVGHGYIPVRIRRKGSDRWEEPVLDRGETAHGATVAATLDIIDALSTGREPVLSGRKALAATELIFATYESSRRRGIVNLPLDVEDSALLAMLDEGLIGA